MFCVGLFVCLCLFGVACVRLRGCVLCLFACVRCFYFTIMCVCVCLACVCAYIGMCLGPRRVANMFALMYILCFVRYSCVCVLCVDASYAYMDPVCCLYDC